MVSILQKILCILVVFLLFVSPLEGSESEGPPGTKPPYMRTKNKKTAATTNIVPEAVPPSEKITSPVVPDIKNDIGNLTPQVVYPEVTTTVEMSSMDVNRVICPVTSSEVNVVYSTEKGMITKVTGNNVFVKFSIVKKKEGEKEEIIYRNEPAELYVVCGSEVFSMVVIPKRIPTQTIKLSTGKKDQIKENIEKLGSLPLEEKIIKLIQSAYKDDIPSSYTVKKSETDMGLYEDVKVTLKRVISADGTGLKLLEYELQALDNKEHRVNESTFLRPELAGKTPLAIALEEHTITGRATRLFIVQMVKEVAQ